MKRVISVSKITICLKLLFSDKIPKTAPFKKNFWLIILILINIFFTRTIFASESINNQILKDSTATENGLPFSGRQPENMGIMATVQTGVGFTVGIFSLYYMSFKHFDTVSSKSDIILFCTPPALISLSVSFTGFLFENAGFEHFLAPILPSYLGALFGLIMASQTEGVWQLVIWSDLFATFMAVGCYLALPPRPKKNKTNNKAVINVSGDVVNFSIPAVKLKYYRENNQRNIYLYCQLYEMTF